LFQDRRPRGNTNVEKARRKINTTCHTGKRGKKGVCFSEDFVHVGVGVEFGFPAMRLGPHLIFLCRR